MSRIVIGVCVCVCRGEVYIYLNQAVKLEKGIPSLMTVL